jgi:hypothetical protein
MTSLDHLHRFALIVGNARSGSTLLGAVLDGHPRAVIANESASSMALWRDLSAAQILADVLDNAARNAATGRPSEGYSYQIGPPPATKPALLVAGDKVWNPATLILHGNHDLIPSLETRLGVPVAIIHAIRDPFDVIATMHARSGAPVADRIRWYFMHCEAAAAIRDRLPADRFLDSHHEDLLADPPAAIERLCGFLHLPLDPGHVAAAHAKHGRLAGGRRGGNPRGHRPVRFSVPLCPRTGRRRRLTSRPPRAYGAGVAPSSSRNSTLPLSTS